VIAASSVRADDAAQLLSNGSFESASALQWDVRLYPRHDAEALERVFGLTDDLAANGSFAARVITDELPAGANLVIVSQSHSAYAWRGKRLQLSAQSILQTERNSDGSPLQLNVRQWGPDDRVVAAVRRDFPNYLGHWTASTLEFDVEPDALRIDIQLMIKPGEADQHKTVMLIDDVRLVEALPADLSLTVIGPEAAMDGGVLPCRVDVGPHIIASSKTAAGTVRLMRGGQAVAAVTFAVDRAMQHVSIPLDGIEPGACTIAVELTGGDGRVIATDANDVLLYHGPFAGD
jgi:hypothetical protein